MKVGRMALPKNRVNKKKLPGSKWTATRPVDREKHFLVQGWVSDDRGRPTDRILIEAVLTRAVSEMHWRDLEDSEQWRVGWC